MRKLGRAFSFLSSVQVRSKLQRASSFPSTLTASLRRINQGLPWRGYLCQQNPSPSFKLRARRYRQSDSGIGLPRSIRSGEREASLESVRGRALGSNPSMLFRPLRSTVSRTMTSLFLASSFLNGPWSRCSPLLPAPPPRFLAS